MTTHTLTANTNLSSLTLANGDSIALAGWQLTIDNLPTATGIDVTTVGTAGTVVFSGAGVNAQLDTWSFTAGTTALISSIPSGVTIGTLTGGTGSNCHGANSSSGYVITLNSGSGPNALGISTNTGRVGTANALTRNCINTNTGTVELANGSTTSAAQGVATNYGVVLVAQGNFNYGVNFNYGMALAIKDGAQIGVSHNYGSIKLIDGPNFTGTFFTDGGNQTTTIYSIGAVNGSATIPGDITVIELSEGSGSSEHSFAYVG